MTKPAARRPQHCIGIIYQKLNFNASGALQQGTSPPRINVPAQRPAVPQSE
jgi:hypothetical protein